MRVMIIAGEASGDLHGAGVVRELKRAVPGCDVYGIGGDKMQAAGMDLVYHVREVSVMGFWEVLQHLPLLKSVERTLAALLKGRTPDVVVLIDYPGFNLRFAKIAKAHGARVVYYISPQVWAWNRGRVKKMKGSVDKMFVAFPFEVEIYRKEGIDVEFVGHPLLDVFAEPMARAEFCTRYGLDRDRPILGLLPGSRAQELERIFPAMLGAARILRGKTAVQVVVGASSVLDVEFIRSFIRDQEAIQVIQHATYDVMSNADIAIVTSGTATLETGYFRTPMIVVYRMSWFSYLIARALVRVRSIGLVNIVAGERIVPELIQGQVTPQRLASSALALMENEGQRREMSERLAVIREKLGTPGASVRVARAIAAMGS